jgi:hypothetical protein
MDHCAATLVPALISGAGDAAGWRYVEFFTAAIRNPNTWRAYARYPLIGSRNIVQKALLTRKYRTNA